MATIPSARTEISRWRPLVVGTAGLVLPLGGMAALGWYGYPRGSPDVLTRATALAGGDPVAGKGVLVRYGCAYCHTIPGVAEARGLVGPPLDHFSNRVYVAGVLRNTPENLIRWIRDPQGVDPMTAMPATGIDDRQARDVAAYLLTLQ